VTAIEEVADRLARYPAARYTIEGNRIRVDPADADGFAVTLEEGPTEFVVHFDGWHEHFADRSGALACFAYGLSDRCRLAVLYRGATPVRWTVEALDGGVWRRDSTTGLLLQPFWRRGRLVHLQNRLLPAA
jgi:hypothetical protein